MSSRHALAAISIVTLAVAPGLAHADGKAKPAPPAPPELLAVLATQVDTFTNTPKKFATTVAKDVVLVRPYDQSQEEPYRGIDDITKHLANSWPTDFMEVDKATLKQSWGGVDGDTGWLTAVYQLHAMVVPPDDPPAYITFNVRLSEVFVKTDGAWKGWVLMYSRPYPDDKLKEYPPVAGEGKPSDDARYLADPSKLAADLADDPSVVVIGSSERELAVGPTAARKLLTAWSKRPLQLDTTVVLGGRTGALSYRIGTVMLHRKKTVVHLPALVVTRHGADDAEQVVLVHFAPRPRWFGE